MDEKQLRRLRRIDLMELLFSQAQEIESLQERVIELEEKLKNREILMAEAGSIAEAALKLNKVFESAQAAADQYLENVGRLADKADLDN
ncbi:DNA repair protein [Streptococcus orisratti]|uniref:DNA repair protein n=1 Tax=Streptococcus orisratti TaxID=114652 RepID=UPI0023F8F8C7|nr:DNA repair protein [Streptococcus orisratti]